MAANESAYKRLGWVLNRSQGGFYALIASPDMQRELFSRYQDRKILIYDYREHEKHYRFAEIAQALAEHPEAEICVLLNLQFALRSDQDVRLLNFSRDKIDQTGKTFLFCMDQAADDRLNRNAYDFYSFIRLFLRFADELPDREAVNLPAVPADRSVGVEVQVDFSWPEPKLLSLAIALMNQGEELEDQARYQDALFVYEKALAIREKVLGDYHPDTATTYNNLGILYKNIGEYDKALDYYLKALAIKEKVLGTDHPYTAQTYNNLGVLYDNMGEYDKALDYYLKALAVREKALGTDHPDTAVTYHNLGNLYAYMGEYVKALDYYLKALAISEKTLGTDHPYTATTYNNLDCLYYAIGKYRKALEYQEKALAIREKVLGPRHPDTILSYRNIALDYNALGNQEKAREYRRKAEAAEKNP